MGSSASRWRAPPRSVARFPGPAPTAYHGGTAEHVAVAVEVTNTTPTATAPLPNVASIAVKFNPMSSASGNMLMFDTSPKAGRSFAHYRAVLTIIPSNGISIVNSSGFNSGHGSAASQGIRSGNASGMKATLTTMVTA